MIDFMKMSGSGNDFILIDNRNRSLAVGDVIEFVKTVCERKVSVGADGLIIIENSPGADFRWRFFNSDGSEVDMCGNGARCAARFACIKGIAKENMSFETGAGLITAEVRGDVVKVKLTDPRARREDIALIIDGRPLDAGFINTGVPHVVVTVQGLDTYDVFNTGRNIRYHKEFQPEGTNANFMDVIDRRAIRIRTYERGVEDETLACGTGAVAASLIAASRGLVESPVDVKVRSGETLTIHFRKAGPDFKDIYLEGKANVVYEGRIWDEAYRR